MAWLRRFLIQAHPTHWLIFTQATPTRMRLAFAVGAETARAPTRETGGSLALVPEERRGLRRRRAATAGNRERARRRSGWLSDKPGSLIRFRVQTAEQLSITYLASFANFGPFRVWAGGKPHSPGAVSVEVDGRRARFSLPRVARFPSTSEPMGALRRSGGSLWIENAGAADGPSRVKILGVVSADCH